MPWQCRLVTLRDSADEIGDMYFSENYTRERTGEFDRLLSPQYQQDWYGKRPPLFVVTPGGIWCADAQSTDGNGNYTGHGWTITGRPPNITATPSINIKGHYHGWLRNGVLTDDCEGRRYS